MKAAILSAGLSRRLAFINKPKGLLKIGKESLIGMTLSALGRLKFSEVFCVIRKDANVMESYLKKFKSSCKITIIKNNSPAPFDSQMVIGKYLSENDGVLAFNVDLVFNYEDIKEFVEKLKSREYVAGKDMVMLASPYVKGVHDGPAFISANSDGRVVDYGKDISSSPYIFGQVRYCSRKILMLYEKLQNMNITRMKPFIKYLIENEYLVYIHRSKNPIYEIDTPLDVKNVSRILGLNAEI